MEVECDDLPEFFNVYITRLSSNRMLIPRDFVKYMGRRKSGLAELVAAQSGETWQIELIEDGEDLYFTNGWQCFVKENYIRDGNFMFFKFHGNLKFSVVIYDESMCEKQIGKSSFGKRCIPEVKEEQNSDNEVMERNVRPRPSKPKAYTQSRPSDAKTVGKNSTSGKPFFEKCISASNVNLNIPKSFCLENSLSYVHGERMLLRTSGNGSWEVSITIHGGPLITRGWSRFVRENCISSGDICKFELLDRLEMMVYVTRACGKDSRKK